MIYFLSNLQRMGLHWKRNYIEPRMRLELSNLFITLGINLIRRKGGMKK